MSLNFTIEIKFRKWTLFDRLKMKQMYNCLPTNPKRSDRQHLDWRLCTLKGVFLKRSLGVS